jgi:signal peptidase
MTKVFKQEYVNIFGYTYFIVATGSMSGTIEVNDIIIVKINDDFKEKDIITYNNKGSFITHRVEKIKDDKVITKGDVNNLEDDPVLKKDIIGRVVFVVSFSALLKITAVLLLLTIILIVINFEKVFKKYILKDMFLPYYHKWLNEREEILKENGQETDSLFITKEGNPANADRLRDWMGNLSDVVGKPLYMHSLRHYNVSMYKRIGLEDDFIVYLTGWSESTGHSMISIYNDMTAKERTWKNLDKLKNALEQDDSINN